MLLHINPCCTRGAVEWASVTISSGGTIDFQKDATSISTGANHRHATITPDATLNPFVLSASTCAVQEANQTYAISNTPPPNYTQITPTSAQSINRLCAAYSTNASPSTAITLVDNDHSASSHEGAEFQIVYDAGGSSISVEGSDWGFTPFNRISIDANIPSGSSAGDTCIIILMDQYKTMITPEGWAIDTRKWCNTTQQKITAYRKTLTASDIAAGTVRFTVGVDKVLEYQFLTASQYTPDDTGRVAATYSTPANITVANGYGEVTAHPSSLYFEPVQNLNLHRQDWTFEVRAYPVVTSGTETYSLIKFGASTNVRFFHTAFSGGLQWIASLPNGNISTGEGVTANAWYDLVMERYDDTIYFYVNNVFKGSRAAGDLSTFDDKYRMSWDVNVSTVGSRIDNIRVYSGAFYKRKDSNLT